MYRRAERRGGEGDVVRAVRGGDGARHGERSIGGSDILLRECGARWAGEQVGRDWRDAEGEACAPE